MNEDEKFVFIQDRLPLEFLKYIVGLADRANELDADRVSFNLGPIDGVSLNVEIRFSYKGLEEAREHDQSNK